MPRDNPQMMNLIAVVLGIIGIICLVYALYKKHETNWTERLYIWIISILIFTLSVIIGSGPWMIKNFGEIGATGLKSNPMSILNGSG